MVFSRLDFDNLVTAAPPTSGTTLGSCTTATDNFQLTSPTGGTLPAVCGTLTGQHSESNIKFLANLLAKKNFIYSVHGNRR